MAKSIDIFGERVVLVLERDEFDGLRILAAEGARSFGNDPASLKQKLGELAGAARVAYKCLRETVMEDGSNKAQQGS